MDRSRVLPIAFISVLPSSDWYSSVDVVEVLRAEALGDDALEGSSRTARISWTPTNFASLVRPRTT